MRVKVKELLEGLLKQEDTTGSNTITIDDKGLKSFVFNDVNQNSYQIKGTYYLSNLLQELALESEKNKTNEATISFDKIYEKPSERISRLIREIYWDRLVRTIDKEGLKKVLYDEKVDQDVFYIYVPFNDKLAYDYYTNVSKELTNIKVEILSENINANYVLSIKEKSGLLALALFEDENGNIKGQPFVVPGGRFNEMYGWDSYFESIGLLLDDKSNLVKGMLENFHYQIKHYGKILNANRSYYLTRTQPPFYSTMLREYLEEVPENIDWVSEKLSSAIQEYENVWMNEGKRLTDNGLNRYHAEGVGYVFETEEGHFKEVLQKYAEEYNLPEEEFENKYKNRTLDIPELDAYFLHDRSLRESGHDTTNRFINKCADLNTVDLNSLLYKYEKDFLFLIRTYFKEGYKANNGNLYTETYWKSKMEARKSKINALLWNEKESLYFDYDFKNKIQKNYVSATTFYPLWAGACSAEQAKLLVHKALPLLKCKGGIVSCSEKSRGIVDELNPNRQWDYPFGWAPHQMLVWKGLQQYGFYKETQELVYRWLWLLTKEAVNYNGVIAEKYDVVNCTHKVDTEYGNVGTDFDFIPDGGFGWMNASYQLGISILEKKFIEKLDDLIDPDMLFLFDTQFNSQ